MKHYYTSEPDALELLMSRGLPEKVVLHCKAVADTSGAMAEALNENGFDLDVKLCVRAGLLHDVARTQKEHEAVGAALLREKGMPREADIVAHHMGWDIDVGAVTEREVVFLADKITAEHHRTTVRERYAPALKMTADVPDVHEKIERALKGYLEMESLYETYLGCSLQEIPIGRKVPPAFLWSDETIAWLAAAANHSNYYKILSGHIAARLPSEPELIDLGCGAGFLTRELAVFAKRITAVDIDARAVEEVRALSLSNVSAMRCDAANAVFDGEYDAAVYCYYGGAEEIVRTAVESGNKMVIAIGSVSDRHNFSSTGAKRRRCFVRLLDLLDKRGIPYELEKIDLDFSQPVRSLEEAVRFYRQYDKRVCTPSRETILKRLVPQDDPDYPYIIPAVRNLGIAVIKKERETLADG